MLAYIPTLFVVGNLCFSAYTRFRAKYPRRGSRTGGFWAACLVLLMCSVLRITLGVRTQEMDLFVFFNVPPTEKGIEFVGRQVASTFSHEPIFTDLWEKIAGIDPLKVQEFWPYLDVSMLRCPYLQTGSTTGVMLMAGPPLLLKLATYLAQGWYIAGICPAARNLQWQFSGMAVATALFELSLLFLGPLAYRYRRNMLYASDFSLSLGMAVYMSIEMVYLQPNRLDPVKVLYAARAQLQLVNEINVASREISQEISASPELNMLLASHARSLGRPPAGTELETTFRLVKQHENPDTYLLQHSMDYLR